jgi:hypothetical protein
VTYSQAERKLGEMNDCALNYHLTQERTIIKFQTAIQNLEQKVADQDIYVNDLKTRLAAAVTVSGAPSHPGGSKNRIYLTQTEVEVLRMVYNAPDLGSLCDTLGLSANDIFGAMKKRFFTHPSLFGKRDENKLPSRYLVDQESLIATVRGHTFQFSVVVFDAFLLCTRPRDLLVLLAFAFEDFNKFKD